MKFQLSSDVLMRAFANGILQHCSLHISALKDQSIKFNPNSFYSKYLSVKGSRLEV